MSEQTQPKSWHLVADVGGTHARFGLQDDASEHVVETQRYNVAEHTDFADALAQFLQNIRAKGGWQATPQAACLAVACPIGKGVAQFTNSPWSVDRLAISRLLAGAPVELINDFAAVGYAVTHLSESEWLQVGGKQTEPNKPIAVLGAGTGLGVCIVVPSGDGAYHVIEGEGGHSDFAPIDAQEIAILQVLSSRFGRVSVERLLSGAGILNIYQALAKLANMPVIFNNPESITAAAIHRSNDVAINTLEVFCRVLGSVAGNLALTAGAKGGVYIAGGIVPQFLDFLEQSEFRQRFDSKGRYYGYLAEIPVRVILKEDLGLLGASKKLNLSEQ